MSGVVQQDRAKNGFFGIDVGGQAGVKAKIGDGGHKDKFRLFWTGKPANFSCGDQGIYGENRATVRTTPPTAQGDSKELIVLCLRPGTSSRPAPVNPGLDPALLHCKRNRPRLGERAGRAGYGDGIVPRRGER